MFVYVYKEIQVFNIRFSKNNRTMYSFTQQLPTVCQLPTSFCFRHKGLRSEPSFPHEAGILAERVQKRNMLICNVSVVKYYGKYI